MEMEIGLPVHIEHEKEELSAAEGQSASTAWKIIGALDVPYVQRPRPAVREFPYPDGTIFGFTRRGGSAEVSEGGTERGCTQQARGMRLSARLGPSRTRARSRALEARIPLRKSSVRRSVPEYILPVFIWISSTQNFGSILLVTPPARHLSCHTSVPPYPFRMPQYTDRGVLFLLSESSASKPVKPAVKCGPYDGCAGRVPPTSRPQVFPRHTVWKTLPSVVAST
ncbi:hypothetical protein B0H13DRAFT_1889648 [Mycena leptocephala]|nr:hypothetical protein B0H13DRAFT_1889648 [Mycena leptocephala]